MARVKAKELTAAIRAPFWKKMGSTQNVANTPNAGRSADWAADNSFELRWDNAAGTDNVRAVSVNSADQVMVGEGLVSSPRKVATWEVADNASIKSQGFFIANPGESYRVTAISWSHETQSSVAGTAYVEKTPSTVAIGSGTSLMSGTFNLHTIANATTTYATLSTTNTGDSDNTDLILNAGDQLSVVISGTITSLVGVHLTVTMAPLGASVKHVSYYMNSNTDLTQSEQFFVATRDYVMTAVSMRWATKCSTASVHLTVTNDTSTTAMGGGTSILTDNTNVGPLVTQTANTTYTGTLSATAATVRLVAGSRLSAHFDGGTFAALAGLVITVSYAETAGDRMERTWFLNHVVGQTTLVGIAAIPVFTADRDYEILDIAENHDVVGSDGGAVTIGVAIATGTTAAASATIVQTDTSNAGFSIKATARATQYATLVAPHLRFLLKGDRLCIVPAGTFTSAKGVAITVAMAPR